MIPTETTTKMPGSNGATPNVTKFRVANGANSTEHL
jgi:hypothetical protein